MSDLDLWLAANDRYLATAMTWLRSRLESLAAGVVPAVTDVKEIAPAPEPAQDAWLRNVMLSGEGQPKPTEAGAPGVQTPFAADAAPRDRLPALAHLSQQLGLSEFESQTLLLCAAMEFDTGMGALCARAQRDAARPYPTFGLALAAFEHPAWDVLSPERPLRHWRLVEINQPGAQPLINSALKADERIVNYIKGLNYLDDRLTPLLQPAGRAGAPLPPSQAAVAEAIINLLGRADPHAPLPVLQLLGADSRGKTAVAQQAAAELHLTLYRLPAEALPAPTGDNETFARLWQRETALLPLALYIDAAQLERGAQSSPLQRFLSRGSGVIFLDTREAWPDFGRASAPFDVAKPLADEQQAVWAAALGAAEGAHAARLSGQFSLDGAAIHAIAAQAVAASARDPAGLGRRLWTGCLDQARPALDQLAQAVAPAAGWDDLELPAPELGLLRQIAAQVKNRMAVYNDWGFRGRMNRGLGISVLFAGESGTGKTMAAEVVARDLGLLLYRIDLSGVVSKYIGETEKNLRKLFDAAEDGGAILFFDEADALFGKRSEVKDSHDRYANIEVNYLLQRMEAYRGLAILATNMKAALDQAFLRRLRFIVSFPFPGPQERLAIWRKVFPRDTPVAGVDFQRLARLNLTGGSIHNIALNAAFLAAEARSAVTMPVVLEAARAEFRKLEKPVNEADFRLLEKVGGVG